MKQTNDEENQSKASQRTGKVERVINDYNITNIGDEIVRSWTNDEEDRQSLRELAEQFNRRLLRATINKAEVGSHDYDIDRTYRLLTTDDVSSGKQTRVRSRLERDGIDTEQLESDFVSHLAVRTYLQHHNATRAESEPDQVAKEAQRIQRLRSRTTAVTESKLKQLHATDRISVGDFRVLTEIQAFCEECETRYDVDELLSQGSCACSIKNWP
jgi:hypothetical protein